MQNLMPFINVDTGTHGFFLYEISFDRKRFHTMFKEDLQLRVNEYVDNVNRFRKEDRLNELVSEIVTERSKLIEESLDAGEEIKSIDYNEIRSSVSEEDILNDLELLEYPIVDDIGYTEFHPEQADYIILDKMLQQFPNISQNELEDIFYYHNTNNAYYCAMIANDNLAELAVNVYESELATSEMLCMLYEQNLEMQEKISVMEGVKE